MSIRVDPRVGPRAAMPEAGESTNGVDWIPKDAGSAPGARRRSSPVGTLVAASDVLSPLAVLLVLGAAESWRGGPGRHQVHTFLLFVGVSWGCFLLASWAVRLHWFTRRHLVPTSTDGLGRAVCAVALGAVGVLAVAALRYSLFAPVLRPEYVVAGAAACIVILPVSRALTLAAFCSGGARKVRVLVVGTGTIAADVAGRLSRSRIVEFAGFVDDRPVPGQHVLGPLGELSGICKRLGIHRVVVAFSSAHPVVVGAALRRLPDSVAIDVVPRYFDLTGWQAWVGDLDGLTVLSLGDHPTRAGHAMKRTVDVLGAGAVLFLTWPVLLVAAGLVGATSPGPVFFRQTRLGRNKKQFEVLKLRTMRLRNANAHGSTVPEKERVTAVGSVLRRTCVDELPQLVNVLRGEMSLVDPRPFVPGECADLPRWAERRFDVRPGLTGLWQVCGQHDLRMEELFRLDMLYVTAWSIASDLRILSKTPGRVLHGGGDREVFRGSAPITFPPTPSDDHGR